MIRRRRVSWLMAAALAVATSAEADLNAAKGALVKATDAVNLETSLRVAYWASSRKLDGADNLVPTSLWFRGRRVLGTGTRLVGDGFLRSDDLVRGDSPKLEIREGYIHQKLGKMSFRAGRQLAVWGRADRINPTDNLITRDFTLTEFEDDDLRRGSAMVRGSATLGDGLTLQAYWLPEFRPNQIPTPQVVGPLRYGGERHPHALGQGALRVDSTTRGVDWSLSYFDGRDRDGDVVPAGVSGTEVRIVREYQHQRTYGGDVALARWGHGFRGEVAYTDLPDRPESDTTKLPFLLLVVGADRAFRESFNLNLQYILRRVTDYRSPDSLEAPLDQAIAKFNAVQAGQSDRYQHGMSFRLAWASREDKAKAEVFGVEDLSGKNGAIRTKLTYSFTDEIRGTIGYDWYHGDHGTLFGTFRPNSGAYVELRRGF